MPGFPLRCLAARYPGAMARSRATRSSVAGWVLNRLAMPPPDKGFMIIICAGLAVVVPAVRVSARAAQALGSAARRVDDDDAGPSPAARHARALVSDDVRQAGRALDVEPG